MQTVIKTTRHAVSRVVDGQALVLDTTRDEIRQLNEVGSLIWSMLLKSNHTREDILHEIITQFEISSDEASVDLNAFLDELSALNLIEYVSP